MSLAHWGPPLQLQSLETRRGIHTTLGISDPVLCSSFLQVHVFGSLGTPLQLQLTDPDGNTVAADTGSVLLQQASQRPLSEADVAAAIGQLGDNALAPACVDVSGLQLQQGKCYTHGTLPCYNHVTLLCHLSCM
jgi:hypothetical protein